MQIEFQHVMPVPLSTYKHNSISVWKNGFSLVFPQKVLLNASSGKGKSTFINILYGLRKDYTGTIKMNDHPIETYKITDWIKLRRTKLSVIFQDLQLFPALTVWENLILKNKLTQHKTEAEIETMLSSLGIKEKKTQLCQTLSLGQQQRVAIIRALLQPFELLLMDEPFSHLDEENTRIALELINMETDLNNAGFILTSLGSHHDFTFDRELNL